MHCGSAMGCTRWLGVLLAAGAVPTVHGLMFHSNAVTSQWDTWAFVENGTFYVRLRDPPCMHTHAPVRSTTCMDH
jgi:hypothetical protein